jgi:hypothetical protein
LAHVTVDQVKPTRDDLQEVSKIRATPTDIAPRVASRMSSSGGGASQLMSTSAQWRRGGPWNSSAPRNLRG